MLDFDLAPDVPEDVPEDVQEDVPELPELQLERPQVGVGSATSTSIACVPSTSIACVGSAPCSLAASDPPRACARETGAGNVLREVRHRLEPEDVPEDLLDFDLAPDVSEDVAVQAVPEDASARVQAAPEDASARVQAVPEDVAVQED